MTRSWTTLLVLSAGALTVTLAIDKVAVANDCAGSSNCKQGAMAVAGHVKMNVQKSGRRLQAVTGFANDANAQKAVKEAIATKANTATERVHTVQSEYAKSPSERRLQEAATSSGVLQVNYTVDCASSTECTSIYTALNALKLEDFTSEVMARLQADGATQYSVAVASHNVDMVPCAIFGKGFNDPLRNNYLNGAVLATALECQQKCAATTYCTYFTWYKNSGGCWLQGNWSTLSIAGDKAEQFAISGPAKCLVAEVSLAAVPVVPDLDEPQAKQLVAAPAEGGGGFPWWGWLAGGVVAAGAVGGGAYMAMGGKDKSKKSQKKDKVSRAAKIEEAMTAQEAAPLMGPAAQTEMQPPQAFNPVGAMAYPQYYNGMPMQMAQPMFTATPMAMAAPQNQYYQTAAPQYQYYQQ